MDNISSPAYIHDEKVLAIHEAKAGESWRKNRVSGSTLTRFYCFKG